MFRRKWFINEPTRVFLQSCSFMCVLLIIVGARVHTRPLVWSHTLAGVWSLEPRLAALGVLASELTAIAFQAFRS